MDSAFDLEPEIVKERLARSRMWSRPTQLWPDIRLDDFDDALRAIATATQSVLLKGRATLYPRIGPALSVAGYVSGMGPLIGYWSENGVVDTAPEVQDVFGLHLRHNRRRMEKLTEETVAVAAQFSAAGLVPTIVKGMHTAHTYFPEPGTRPVSDVDLVTGSLEGMAIAQGLLAAAGYLPDQLVSPDQRQDWRRPDVSRVPRSLAFVHADDPWSIDLQASLDRYFPGRIRMQLNDLANYGAMPGWPLAPGVRVLPQPLLTLQLAMHASQGFLSLNLLRLVELVFAIRTDIANRTLRWDEFITQADRIGAIGFVYPALRFAEELAPGTIPQDVLGRSGAATPPAVQRVVARHSCWSIQRIHRWSREEAFMWCGGTDEKLRAVAAYLAPRSGKTMRSRFGLYPRQLGIALRLLTSRT